MIWFNISECLIIKVKLFVQFICLIIYITETPLNAEMNVVNCLSFPINFSELFKLTLPYLLDNLQLFIVNIVQQNLSQPEGKFNRKTCLCLMQDRKRHKISCGSSFVSPVSCITQSVVLKLLKCLYSARLRDVLEYCFIP